MMAHVGVGLMLMGLSMVLRAVGLVSRLRGR